MEKLIELLNEYDRIKWDKEEPIYNWKIAIKTKIYQKYLISKEYWFVKWLIDNYYIELPMWLWVVKSYDKESWLFNYFSDYESLLMLLSIQEDPIEFLIKLIQ